MDKESGQKRNRGKRRPLFVFMVCATVVILVIFIGIFSRRHLGDATQILSGRSDSNSEPSNSGLFEKLSFRKNDNNYTSPERNNPDQDGLARE